MSSLVHALSAYQAGVGSRRDAAPPREPATTTFDDALSDVVSGSGSGAVTSGGSAGAPSPSPGAMSALADVGPAGQGAAEPAIVDAKATTIEPSMGVPDGRTPVVSDGGKGAPEPANTEPAIVSDLEKPVSDARTRTDEFARAREELVQFATFPLRMPFF